MSRENVDAVGAAWDAWERGDMEALFRFYDSEIEWDLTHAAGGPGAYRGHGGIRHFFREWVSAFEKYWAHPEQFIDAGDRVVVCMTQGGVGKDSGVAVEMPPYFTSTGCEIAGRYVDSVRPVPDASVSAPLEWDEVPAAELADFTLATVPARLEEKGDPSKGLPDSAGSLEPLLDLAARDEAEGLGDAPWPPNFAKQPGEPRRVQPSRAKKK